MPVVLLRVDERLIHGQVVVGWGTALKPERLVVVDDALVGSSWEQDLYRLGVPVEVGCEFVSVDAARQRITGWSESTERVVMVLRDIAGLARLAEGGLLANEEINLGGIHYTPDREPVLPYLFLSSAERATLQAIALSGAQISARDLPGARRVPLCELLA